MEVNGGAGVQHGSFCMGMVRTRLRSYLEDYVKLLDFTS